MSAATLPVQLSSGTPDVSVINAQWTLRLRFGSLLGQLATIVVVFFGMGIRIPLTPLAVLISLGTASNILCLLYIGQQQRRSASVPLLLLPALMAFDVLHLTAMLYLTGGPMNPFSFMYLVLIALATVVLPPRATWALVGLSVACSAVLFLWHRPLNVHGHAVSEDGTDPMRIHLYGMWVAFSVAAAFIVYFLLRIRRALGQREAELEAARSLAARRDKLASLATLAAGAAHELATPLGTIAIAAKELERQLRSGPGEQAALEDVQLIRGQVARCRSVLDQLGREAGDNVGESLVPASMSAVVAAAQEGLAGAAQVRVQIDNDVAHLPLRLPLRSLAQALRALFKNALESSPPGATVEVSLRLVRRTLKITVADHGSGMSAETLRRLGEPFFTTKAPGSGMGLGVFLCHAVFESLNGQLVFSSILGQGTQATVTLPLDGAVALSAPPLPPDPGFAPLHPDKVPA